MATDAISTETGDHRANPVPRGSVSMPDLRTAMDRIAAAGRVG